MKIVFFGTPEYVVPIVDALHKEYNRGRERQLIAVVTQPPKPVGRDKKVEHSEVDHWAYKHGLPIATDINDSPEGDLGILASYGQIIPGSLIQRYEHGILNVHPSALPKLRGASPIQATILTGNEYATVTVMLMDEKMDHGPIVSTFKEEIRPDDTSGELRKRLFERSSEFLLELIPNYLAGKIKTKVQDHEAATFTTMINKQDGYIKPEFLEAALNGQELDDDWEIRWIKGFVMKPNAVNLDRFIRAMNPWPITWTILRFAAEGQAEVKEKRLQLLQAHLEEGKLILDKVQLEGKNEVSWKEFTVGYSNFRFR